MNTAVEGTAVRKPDVLPARLPQPPGEEFEDRWRSVPERQLCDYGQSLCYQPDLQTCPVHTAQLRFTSTLPTMSPVNNKAQHTAPFLWSWCQRTQSHRVKSLHRSFLPPVSQGAHKHATPITTDTLSVDHGSQTSKLTLCEQALVKDEEETPMHSEMNLDQTW